MLFRFHGSAPYCVLQSQMENIAFYMASALLQVEQSDKGQDSDMIDKAEVSATHSTGNNASSKLL